MIIHCKYCNDVHICHTKKQEEEREYQKEQQAYRKKMRRITQLKTRREWLTRLSPRRPKTAR